MTKLPTTRLAFVDSHTGGEPTRVITQGFPALNGADVSELRDDLQARHATLMHRLVDEPYGTEAMVAALCVTPACPAAVAGVIFADRGAVLGMCGHGTIGLVATLAHLGRLTEGTHLIETAVGVVETQLHADGTVTVGNVDSYVIAADVALDVPDIGTVQGDMAWGGNTFFLANSPQIDLDQDRTTLLAIAQSILTAAHRAGFGDVDHVELFGPPTIRDADSRNFVLCPNGTYDRSPCGTGTSAKLACLANRGRLGPGETWRQESITGSVFSAQYEPAAGNADAIAPRITGAAQVIAAGELFVPTPAGEKN